MCKLGLLFYHLKHRFWITCACCPVEVSGVMAGGKWFKHRLQRSLERTFGKCRFFIFPSLSPGSSGFGGRVRPLNKVGEELGFPTTDAGEIFPAPPEPEPTCWSCLGQIPDGCLSLTLGGSAKEEDHPAGTYKWANRGNCKWKETESEVWIWI